MEREKNEQPLATVFIRYKAGEIPSPEVACREVWEELDARLLTPEDMLPDLSDFDAGYMEGVNDARQVARILVAAFCGIAL